MATVGSVTVSVAVAVLLPVLVYRCCSCAFVMVIVAGCLVLQRVVIAMPVPIRFLIAMFTDVAFAAVVLLPLFFRWLLWFLLRL